MPEDVQIVEVLGGTLIAWSEADDAAGIEYQGGGDLLTAFLKLNTAEPADIADFVSSYGVLELCQHGRPDRHPDSRRKGPYCGPLHAPDGRRGVSSADVRRAALAFGAAKNVALALSARTLPDPDAWMDMARLQVWGVTGRPPELEWPVTEWREGRAALASWLTYLLHDSGVVSAAEWSGPRLVVRHRADGLFGTLALLLSREIGQGDTYRCDVCDAVVDRIRPPKPHERVYCKKAACRREQQRRNQAAWRARTKEAGTT